MKADPFDQCAPQDVRLHRDESAGRAKYPCVLARLGKIKQKDLRELHVNSREFVASMKKARKA